MRPTSHVLARLPREPGVEVRCELTGAGVQLATYVQAADGCWWRSEAPPELTYEELLALKIKLAHVGATLGWWDLDEVLSTIAAAEADVPEDGQ